MLEASVTSSDGLFAESNSQTLQVVTNGSRRFYILRTRQAIVDGFIFLNKCVVSLADTGVELCFCENRQICFGITNHAVQEGEVHHRNKNSVVPNYTSGCICSVG